MTSANQTAHGLPAPTRAKRSEPRKAPPFKLYIAGGLLVCVTSVAAMAVLVFMFLNFIKDKGYDTELAQNYPLLAMHIFHLKNSKLADDFNVDKANGIVTYHDIRTDRRVKVQEANGTLKFLSVDEEVKEETVSPPPVPKKPPKKVGIPPRKPKTDNF